MKKFEYEGKWYQELDPKDYKIFDEIECLVRDDSDGVWIQRILSACVKRNSYNFITTTNAFYQCAIPCDPPESRLMTNRELSELLAKGYGQLVFEPSSNAYSSIAHSGGNEGKQMKQSAKIRSWDSTEWIKPTIDIYNKFLNKDHK